MPEIYRKLFDSYEAFQTLEVKDLAIPTFAGLWVLTLLIPLTGINKRDIATAAAYVAYLTASAIALLFILPSQYIYLDINTISQAFTLIAVAIVATLRWWFRDDLAPRKEELYNGTIPEEVSE